ncbi:MAG: dihydrofolate reductase family protein [Chitinophagaceae bacterium]|nr:dihydrofolate reductase family protein [Chitinophagaceae bacterium]
MGKLIMWNIITLDGYFEGENNWELPFHMTVWGPELEKFSLDQLENCSYLVFGRVTYEGMAAHWQKETDSVANWMNSLPKVVCSTTLTSADWNNSILIKENVADSIAALKAKSEKDLYVFGSAILSHTLINHNLFDEYRICIAPALARKGRHLFTKGIESMNLSLKSARPLENGGVVLTYVPKT